MSGNNEKLGKRVAESIGADFIKVTDVRKRSMMRTGFDMILNRTPKINENTSDIKAYDQIIFMAPVWMGQVASPLRSYFKLIKDESLPYAFVTISGGTLNKNPKLRQGLKKNAGQGLVFMKDLYLADMNIDLDKESGMYSLTEEDLDYLTPLVVETIEIYYEI